MKMRSRYVKLLALGGLSMVAIATVMPDRRSIDNVSDADIAAMMQGRSPGARVSGTYATKVAKVAQATAARPRPQPPSPRTSAVLPVAAPAVTAVAPALIPAAPVSVAAPLATPAVLPMAVGAPGLGVASILPLIPAVAVGGGGGGGSGSGPPITGAVPEPGTWLMLIIGFGMIGSALRLRRRRALSAGDLQPEAGNAVSSSSL